jgi:hypothetical protein
MAGTADDTADLGDYVKDYDEETDLEVLVEPWQKYDIKKTQHMFVLGKYSMRDTWLNINWVSAVALLCG